MQKTNSGFTIVELLIVIVVIAILAAISIVAYNGVQERARVSVQKSDILAIAKQASLFMVDDGAPPNTSTEWGSVLRNANLFDATRDASVKRFIFCYDATKYAIITNSTKSPFYFVKNGAPGEANWDSTVTGTYTTDKTCKQPSVLPSYTGTLYSDQAT